MRQQLVRQCVKSAVLVLLAMLLPACAPSVQLHSTVPLLGCQCVYLVWQDNGVWLQAQRVQIVPLAPTAAQR